MRKLIRCSIAFTLTFGFGLILAGSYGYFFPQRVSLCTLARNPAKYHRKLVRVEAWGSIISSNLYSDKYIIIFDSNCADHDAGATVDAADLVLSKDVERFINSPSPEIRKAKIDVVGRFNQSATPGCFAPRFGIKAKTVTLTSAVEHEPLPKMPAHNFQ